MIKLSEDFNRPTLPPEEQPYRNLLSAVVLQAVDDANRSYDPHEVSEQSSTDSTTAFNFLFITGGLDLYCAWLGYNAQAIRQALLSNPKFHNVQARYKQWYARVQNLATVVDSDLQLPLLRVPHKAKSHVKPHKKKL